MRACGNTPLLFRLHGHHRLVADQEGTSVSGSDDEGQTTDVEAQSDKEEEEVENVWRGKEAVGDEEKKAKVDDGVGDSSAAEEREERRRRTEQLRRSLSSSPMKLRVRGVFGWLFVVALG